MFDNTEVCTTCGGDCCKSLPGACFPADFGLPGDFTKLDAAINSGRYCIDWWEGDPRDGKNELVQAYYVRPATRYKVGVKYDGSYGGKCNFLTEQGCELVTSKRPTNCQHVEPVKDGPCVLHGDNSKHGAAIAWLPYHDKLKEEE
jgi:hypothetical protein